MTSWPRGSNIRACRTQSCSARKIWRFSAIETAGRIGAPPATTRTGLPQVCASMQRKVWGCVKGGMSAEPRDGEGSEVDRGYASRHEIRDEAAGGWAERQAQVPVPERVEHVGLAGRAADHREAVGGRRSGGH